MKAVLSNLRRGTFRELPSSPIDRVPSALAPVYGVSAQIIFRNATEEVYQGFGAWVGHFQNRVNFSPAGQQKLVIAVLDEHGPAPCVHAVTNPRSAPLPHRARARIQVLQQTQALAYRLLTDAVLDVEVTLLDGAGHLLRRVNLKYEREESGVFKLSAQSDQENTAVAVSVEPTKSSPKPNAIAYATYETKGENALQAQAYVRPSTLKEGWFTFESSFDEEHHGPLEETAMRFAAFDKRMRMGGYVRMLHGNSGDQAFSL